MLLKQAVESLENGEEPAESTRFARIYGDNRYFKMNKVYPKEL